MKILNYVSTDKVAAFDIETVRYKKTFPELSETWQNAWRYKCKQDGVVPSDEELNELWMKNSSLYPEFSKVCAVSVAFLNQGQLRCKNFVSSDERTLLRNLAVTLNILEEKKFVICGHASQYFDVPFLCKRYVANGLQIPGILDSTNKKPWEESNLDTNVIWKSFGTGPGSSLQALCAVLNVPTSKVDLVGDEVGTAFFNGELVRIADYCNLDAVATFNVLRRFKRESIFQFSEVFYTNQGEVIEPVPFLDEIFKSKVITQEQALAIREFCKGFTPEDMEHVIDILNAAVITKGVIAPAISEFIESLRPQN